MKHLIILLALILSLQLSAQKPIEINNAKVVEINEHGACLVTQSRKVYWIKVELLKVGKYYNLIAEPKKVTKGHRTYLEVLDMERTSQQRTLDKRKLTNNKTKIEN